MVVGGKEHIDTAVGRIVCVLVRCGKFRVAGVRLSGQCELHIGHGHICGLHQPFYACKELGIRIFHLLGMEHHIPDDEH